MNGDIMKIEHKTITPTDAAQMLDKNTINRPMNTAHIRHLALEMKTGRWKLNGDTIVVNGDVLIDGQHRLAACLQSGVSFETIVVYGLPQDIFSTKDTGKRRSAGDTLSTLGEMNTNALAAALLFIRRYQTNCLRSGAGQFTNIDAIQLLEKYPSVRRSVDFVRRNKARGLAPNSVLSGCHYLFAEKDQELADQFMSNLISGAGIDKGDPVYILRERLMANGLARAKLSKVDLSALIIKAWNATREGRAVENLRWRTTGPRKEDFPVIR